MIERITTGIPGLDDKIAGGFEKGSVISIVGAPGTGKSLFGLQFLYKGALNNEKGLYISLEESTEDLIKDMEEIGFDKAKELIDKGLLTISFYSPLNFEYLNVIDEILNKGYHRLVIDSLSSISLNWEDKSKFRKFMIDFVQAIKKANVTAIMIDEQPVSMNEVKAFSSEYLSDAVIELFYASLGSEFDRSMQILKMRRTPITHGIIPMKIDKGGIYVKWWRCTKNTKFLDSFRFC